MARETSLDIRSTNHPSYEWLLLNGEFMTSVPVIPFLWDRWWRLEQTGLMVAGVQWVSCLVYADRDNPVFAANAGGAQFLPEPSTTGLPAPAANVAFLEATLSYEWALGRATALLERLDGTPHGATARQMHIDLETRATIVEKRLGMLFAALSEIGSWHALSTWGDP
ncbi:MAG: hypothetical protein AAFR79_16660 [Pseudomonadota bacterium]